MVLGTSKRDGLKMVKKWSQAPQNGCFKNGKKMVSGLPWRGPLEMLKNWSKNTLKMVAGETWDHLNSIFLRVFNNIDTPKGRAAAEGRRPPFWWAAEGRPYIVKNLKENVI